MKRLVYVIMVLLPLVWTGCSNSNRQIALPENPEVLFDTTVPGREYKRQSISYSIAQVVEMNKRAYRRYYSDSLRTDICFKFYYTGNEFDKEELQKRLAGENMYNTIIYWDKECEFASKNGIGGDIHFIGYVADMYNNLLKLANPTVLNFSEESLDLLQYGN